MKAKIMVFVLFILAAACKKSDGPNVVVNGALTNCVANANCTFYYYDGADINNIGLVVAGGDRAFSYSSMATDACGFAKQLKFTTPLNNNDFDISASQIASGSVIFGESCACCYFAYIPKPIGGEVKGKKMDAAHWLVNATVILGNLSSQPIDTLVVNQYFTLNSL